MAKKTIVARTYIAGKPLGKVTYDTNENNALGKKLARLFLDEIVDWVRTTNKDDESWAVTYTDGYEELAFTSNGRDADAINVEVDGEVVKQISKASDRAIVMWDWLAKKGWY